MTSPDGLPPGGVEEVTVAVLPPAATVTIPWHHGVTLAKNRVVVRLTDGRTGRVINWPIPREVRRNGARSNGAKVKIQLEGGAIITVPVDHVTELAAP